MPLAKTTNAKFVKKDTISSKWMESKRVLNAATSLNSALPAMRKNVQLVKKILQHLTRMDTADNAQFHG